MRGRLFAWMAGMAAVAATAVAPAAAGAQTTFRYDVVRSSIAYDITFRGDGSRLCEDRGLCHYSGAIGYRFTSRIGTAAIEFEGRRLSSAMGTADLFGRGITRARVVNERDPAFPCRDEAPHGFDGLTFEGSRGRMRVTVHADEDGENQDYLDTLCAGPGDPTLELADALPTHVFPLAPFRSQRFTFSFAGTKPFRGDGFIGTVRWRVTATMRRTARTQGRRDDGVGGDEPAFTGTSSASQRPR